MIEDILYVIENERMFDIVLPSGEVLATFGLLQCCESFALGYEWQQGRKFKIVYQ